VGSNEWGSCLTSQTTAQPKPSSQAAESAINPFPNGSEWVRADFHLHTKADKEFEYDGEENAFPAACVDRLKQEGIGIGVITNHNKFDLDEFKALRRRARREGIGLLPGVELSVNDGANGVHTLAVFSDEWLADGQDYINQFLNVAFAGKIPAQYEQENGRSNDDLITTLKKLEGYNKDFFIVFAHVEAASGLWSELHGGRMQELAQHPLIQKYCLGFQKVRTHDKPDAKCRVKVQQWWGNHYPAEVEGSDPKKLDEIGRGEACYLQIGDLSFSAVKCALTDFINSVGTARRDQREIDPETFQRSKCIIVGTKEGVFGEAGDAVAARDMIREESVHDLATLVTGKAPGRTSDQDITLFKSVGTGIQDIALAAVIYRRAVEAGLGRELGEFPYLKRQ
jgi:hypothetical protein